MGAHVDSQVVHSSKAGVTAFLRASVGLFTSMLTLMLLEIAPLTGDKLTAGVAASAGRSRAGVNAAVDCQVGLALGGKAAAWLRAFEGPVCWI